VVSTDSRTLKAIQQEAERQKTRRGKKEENDGGRRGYEEQ